MPGSSPPKEVMKKTKTGKAGQFSQKQIDANSRKLLQATCDKLLGPGSFNKFSPICQAKLIFNRFPALKLKLLPDANISTSDAKVFNELFVSQLREYQVTSLTGEQIPLNIFLREAVLLVCYAEIIDDQNLPNYQTLKEAFAPYSREKFITPLHDLVQLLYRFSVLLSDWSLTMLRHDITNVAHFSGDGTLNEVRISMVKPRKISVKIDGIKRDLFRVSWPDYLGAIDEVSVIPSKLGLYHPEKNKPLEVYIQKHAISRLAERIGIVPGIVHQAVYDTMKYPKENYQSHGETSLVELYIYQKKLGYLVCTLHEKKIIVRTFLFLTNDGTPEGKKLSELTRLQLLDKQYLGIDTLAGFIKYEPAKNSELAELFTTAGCESLLNLDEIKTFRTDQIHTQDLSILLKYLQGIEPEKKETAPE